MRVPALKYLGGIFMFLFKACLKAAADEVSLTSFGRLFHARIVEGKKDSRNRFVLALWGGGGGGGGGEGRQCQR